LESLDKAVVEAAKEPQVSPLRCAPVEMTILLSARCSVSTSGPRDCRSLGFARDDKGEGNGSLESGCRTEAVFSTLWSRVRALGMTKRGGCFQWELV
jgi:hypothetical protein